MATLSSPGSPILIYDPDGGVPVGPVSNPPVYSQAGTTPLIEGQAYVDVVFGSVQTTDEWVLVECVVVNEIDAEPLNIWPGIITDKAAAGFRLQLNGMPDSGNYYLHWAVSGVNIAPTPATTYILSGPTSGSIGVAHTFTVYLPPSTTVPSAVTVTPGDGDEFSTGSFSPTSVTLTTGSPSATFTYTPGGVGTKTISVINSGGLLNPASITFEILVATGYSMTGPSSGDSGVESTPFTVTLTPLGIGVLASVTVTPAATGGGTFTPTTVALTTLAPSDTFTYTPASGGTKTISATNDGGLTNPANLSYESIAPFDPSTIAGLKLWLKADSLALTDGAAVTAWNDDSGNAYNLTGTATYKTAIVNGKPIVRFNGTSDSLWKVSALISGGALTVVFVAKAQSLTQANFFWSSGPQVIGLDGSGFYTIYAGSAQLDATNHSNAFHVFTAMMNAAGTSLGFVDGTGVIAGSAGPTVFGSCALMSQYGGIAPFYPGDIAEICVYDSLLGTTDRVAVQDYMKAKYGIP